MTNDHKLCEEAVDMLTRDRDRLTAALTAIRDLDIYDYIADAPAIDAMQTIARNAIGQEEHE